MLFYTMKKFNSLLFKNLNIFTSVLFTENFNSTFDYPKIQIIQFFVI